MKSTQTHATKSNLPMKLSTNAKKTKRKKRDKGDLGFDIVDSVIVTVTKREEERDVARITVR